MTAVPNPEDIPKLVADRKHFDKVLYTPLSEAYDEIERRRRDPHLERQVSEFLGGNILEPLRDEPRAVIARSVVSPNYETRRFDEVVRTHGWIEPLYLEYHADTFTPNNRSKHMLGRLFFNYGTGKHGGMKLDSLNILDFACSNGKRFSSVKTLCGQGFIDFHHDMFDACYRKLSHTFHDTTSWLYNYGKNAKTYYPALLSLFIRNGILFENVLLNEEELSFTSRILLPAFISVYRRFNLKPLIVPLVPTDVEDSRLWMCYPAADRAYIAEKMRPVA